MSLHDISISEEVTKRLICDHIPVSEIQNAVDHCVSTRKMIIEANSGLYTGYMKIGGIVLWVQFFIPAGQAVIADYYYNKTDITGFSDETLKENTKISPFLEKYATKKIICCKCDLELELKKVFFKYLKHPYSSVSYVCSSCGQVFVPKELIAHQAEQIETLLEQK